MLRFGLGFVVSFLICGRFAWDLGFSVGWYNIDSGMGLGVFGCSGLVLGLGLEGFAFWCWWVVVLGLVRVVFWWFLCTVVCCGVAGLGVFAVLISACSCGLGAADFGGFIVVGCGFSGGWIVLVMVDLGFAWAVGFAGVGFWGVLTVGCGF